MINEDKRQAIHTLYNEGMSKKEISQIIKVDIKTVRKVLAGDVKHLPKTRCDKKELDVDIVRELYQKCTGHIQRVHEILTEEHKINVGYSTLTRFIRSKCISKAPHSTKRHHRVEDVPGEDYVQMNITRKCSTTHHHTGLKLARALWVSSAALYIFVTAKCVMSGFI